MPAVVRFDRRMFEQYCKSMNLKYLVDSQGNFRVGFAHDEERGCQLTVWLLAAGSTGQILAIRVESDRQIPKSDWPRAMLVCNMWNQTRRWPKAYLNVEDPQTEFSATIELEHQVDLEPGIYQELLNDMINTTIVTAFSFWSWAHKEQGF